MKNLTSIAEHSDWLQSLHLSDRLRWHLHRLRVAFGKQHLEIWQFVPSKFVGGVWVVLEDPKWEKSRSTWQFEQYTKEYQQAKSLCLFEGFEYIENDYIQSLCVTKNSNEWLRLDDEMMDFMTIEDLVKYNLKLTATAQKEIGL